MIHEPAVLLGCQNAYLPKDLEVTRKLVLRLEQAIEDAGLLDPPVADRRPGGTALPRLRPSDLRLTRRGVLVHRLLVLDVLRDDAVADALADLGLPRS